MKRRRAQAFAQSHVLSQFVLQGIKSIRCCKMEVWLDCGGTKLFEPKQESVGVCSGHGQASLLPVRICCENSLVHCCLLSSSA